MKKTSDIALCGVFAALSLAIMLLAYFDYLVYGLPAIAGCLLSLIVIEVSKKYAWLVFCVVSAIALFICNKEAALAYFMFFGFYPIVKYDIERIISKAVQWLIKVLMFNIAFGAVYAVSLFILDIEIETLGNLGYYSLLVLFAVANVMFVVYDIALTRLITVYIKRYQKRFHKLIKRK